jgi:hypothetical protein
LRRVGRAHGDPVDAGHFGVLTRSELAGLWTELADWFAS